MPPGGEGGWEGPGRGGRGEFGWGEAFLLFLEKTLKKKIFFFFFDRGRGGIGC